MSRYPGLTQRDVGNFYGLRTWVEYGLKQSKNELSWADYRLTHYPDIERWWEIVCSAYLMVSLHSQQMLSATSQSKLKSKLASHSWWDDEKGWKNILNNLRLIIQPFTLFNLIYPWLTVNTVYLRSNKWYTRYDVQKSKLSIVPYKKLLLESPKLKISDRFKAIEIAIPSTEIEAAILKAKAFIETASWTTITTGSMSNHSNELMVKRFNARRTKKSN
jgi:hypothetical protein